MEDRNSSADLHHQIERANLEPHRPFSEGDHPQSPTSHPLFQPSTEIQPQPSSPHLTSEEQANSIPMFSGVEMEAILGPYTRLPTPPEGSGEDIGLDFNPHLPPWPVTSNERRDLSADLAELPHLPESPLVSSPLLIAHRRSPSPLVMAVDAAADGLEELSPIPDSPVELSRLALVSHASFSASVEELIQSRPDSPIGGQEAAPMAIKPKRSFNVGTLLTNNGKPLPRIEVSYADCGPFAEIDYQLQNGRTSASESQVPPSARMENRPPRSTMLQQTSDNSPPMITAPESPRSHSRTDGSDMDAIVHEEVVCGDMELAVIGVRDFALASDGSRSKKPSKVPDADSTLVEHDALDPDFCEDCNLVSPLTKAPIQAPLPLPNNGKSPSGKPNPGINSAGKAISPSSAPKNAGKKAAVRMNLLNESKGAPLPVDATGALPAPDTPKPNKGNKLLNKGHRAVRKCRGAVCRTPVLQVIVGRQLAPTCSQGLKLIAAGGSIETPKLVPVDVPAPVPV